MDLDGTLVRTDTLHESILLLCRHFPGAVRGLIPAMLRGRAAFKSYVAARVVPRPEKLPFSAEVIEYLRSEHTRGRQIYLVTGANESVARAIAEHLGFFQAVISSNHHTNLTGSAKAAELRSRFDGGFEYLGNSITDLPVWESSSWKVAVDSQPALLLVASLKKLRFDRILRVRKSSIGVVSRVLRVKQWIKNILVFVPLALSHQLSRGDLRWRTCVAAAAFCAASSAVYVINDIIDIDGDRQHPDKRHRPIAAGDISLPAAAIACVVCLAAAAFLAFGVNPGVAAVLAGYVVISVAYSLVLKKVVALDVLILAGLYGGRIAVGAIAAGVYLSPWLIQFSTFAFLSLALIKRYSELRRLRDRGFDAESNRRGYRVSDMEILPMLGTSSGVLSALIIGLYIQSPGVERLYSKAYLLWGLCPVVLFWFSRVWIRTLRGEVSEDPLVLAYQDPLTFACVLCSLIIVAAAV